jgi:hypothetical protein
VARYSANEGRVYEMVVEKEKKTIGHGVIHLRSIICWILGQFEQRMIKGRVENVPLDNLIIIVARGLNEEDNPSA